MGEEKWGPCPRCGSKRVNKSQPWSWVLGGISILGYGIWILVIPSIGPMIVLGVLVECKDCKKVWNYQGGSGDNN